MTLAREKKKMGRGKWTRLLLRNRPAKVKKRGKGLERLETAFDFWEKRSMAECVGMYGLRSFLPPSRPPFPDRGDPLLAPLANLREKETVDDREGVTALVSRQRTFERRKAEMDGGRCTFVSGSSDVVPPFLFFVLVIAICGDVTFLTRSLEARVINQKVLRAGLLLYNRIINYSHP